MSRARSQWAPVQYVSETDTEPIGTETPSKIVTDKRQSLVARTHVAARVHKLQHRASDPACCWRQRALDNRHMRQSPGQSAVPAWALGREVDTLPKNVHTYWDFGSLIGTTTLKEDGGRLKLERLIIRLTLGWDPILLILGSSPESKARPPNSHRWIRIRYT